MSDQIRTARLVKAHLPISLEVVDAGIWHVVAWKRGVDGINVDENSDEELLCALYDECAVLLREKVAEIAMNTLQRCNYRCYACDDCNTFVESHEKGIIAKYIEKHLLRKYDSKINTNAEKAEIMRTVVSDYDRTCKQLINGQMGLFPDTAN